jgi:hypothetical protein
MKVELELPPLPGGWANGPVDIGHGQPPPKSMVLVFGKWVHAFSGDKSHHIYAARKWQPAIVTAGVLAPGWIVIDEDGVPWNSDVKPTWDDAAREWAGVNMYALRLSETPQVTGRNAIWEIK